jgi:hypothetical protein
MAEEDQAQADLPTETTVADPLDAANSQNTGITDLSNYEDEIEAMKQGGEIQLGDDDELEESADDETETLVDPDDLADEPAEEEEEEDEPSAKSQERFRFKSDDDKAVAAIAKAKGVSLVEAARIYSGEQPQARATESTQEQQSEQSESLSSIEAEIDSLYEQKDAAIRAIDVDTQAELEKQIRQLEKKARLLAVTEAEQSAKSAHEQLEKAQKDFDTTWDFSRSRYPELNDPNSAMYKEVARLDAEMQELGDPLANDPKRLWDLAKRAGLNTRTPMTKPRESSAPAKGKTGSPVKPAAGNRGTTSADSNQKFEQKVDGLQSLDEYEESVRLMLGKA